MPSGNAQLTDKIEPYPYIGAVPNPVGINQEVVIHVGSPRPLAHPQTGWHDLSVTIEKPDGQTEVIDGINTDTTGGTAVVYVPTMEGTYKLQTHFPEQILETNSRGIPAGTTIKESTSSVLELIVQQEPVPTYPGIPLPTEYWTRPIHADLREWSDIAGNWLGYFQPTSASPHSVTATWSKYNDAPETAHVLWAKPVAQGGIAGGQQAPYGFVNGDAYEGKFITPVIIGGILFLNTENRGGWMGPGVTAIDLHTGKELWYRDDISVDFGQVMYVTGMNHHGVYGYLWDRQGSTWHAYDPFTGRWLYTMENVPSGTITFGPDGEIFIYTVNLRNGWMSKFNNKLLNLHSSTGLIDYAGRGVHGEVFDISEGEDYDVIQEMYAAGVNYRDIPDPSGIEWNVSITTNLPGSVYKVRDGIILGSDFSRGTTVADEVNLWAMSIEPGREGQVLWQTTWKVPAPYTNLAVEDVSVEDDVFVMVHREAVQLYGFRLSTGEKIWGPTEAHYFTDAWGYASGNSWDIITEGKLIAGSYGGTVWCHDVKTGEVLWTYDIENPYGEFIQGPRFRFRPAFVSDGKLYIENTEHNPREPQLRSAPFIALDLETGEEVFRIDGLRSSEWSSTAIIGDGNIVAFNSHDNQVYTLGKGPTATEVSIKNNVIPQGNSVLIEGKVTDISPGTQDPRITARFPDGVPAVADGNMSKWMQYVYMQFPCPSDINGLEITLSVIDSNNNSYDIGTTTTDASGSFSYMWTPEIPGKHTVIATFAGSKSYWPSFSQTAAGVTDPLPQPTEKAIINLPPTELYFAISTVAIIAAIAIVGLLLLRKRP